MFHASPVILLHTHGLRVESQHSIQVAHANSSVNELHAKPRFHVT
jgi:hypothetical protein